MKKIACGDLVPGCDYKATAQTEAELLGKVSEHVRRTHPEIKLTPALVDRAKAKVVDTPTA